MGKKVMYCFSCKESFAENFSFCPKCAAVLTASANNSIVGESESYNVTFVEEKSGKTRRNLLLGATVLVTGGAIFSLIVSIYNADAYVNALDDSLIYLANVNNEDASKIEDLEIPAKTKAGKGAGGGAGGRDDEKEVSKGDLPPQFKEKPLLTPSKEDISVSDPSIPVIRATKGPNDLIPEKKSKTNGLPNSKFEVASDGSSDSNLGMGRNGDSGIGNNGKNGVGSNGEGGIGNNIGDRYGNRLGSGDDLDKNSKRNIEEEPPKLNKPVGVTIALKILSKPRAIYTNEARKNQRDGTVTLRVTFMADGSIGNIAVVSGLPDGLTEQAIAAARNIQFEPAKKNGIPQTVSKQVQYTFTLY